MISVARILVISGLLVNSVSFASESCRMILGDEPLKIDAVMDDLHNSRIKDNFKLQMASVFQTIEGHYGPRTTKAQTSGIDWAQLKPQTLKIAGSAETSNDRYNAVADFFAKWNDAHISVQLPSTLTYGLPLNFNMAEGKIILASIGKKYPSSLRIPNPGDELIGINGKTPDEFQKQYLQLNANGNPLTNKSIFALKLSRFSEAGGMPLSKLNWKDLELTLQTMQGGNYTVKVPLTIEGLGLIGKDLDGKDPHPQVISGRMNSAEKDSGEGHAPRTTGIIRRALSLFRTDTLHIVNDLGGKSPNKTKEIDRGQKMQIGGHMPFFKLPADFKPITVPSALLMTPILNSFFSPKSYLAGTFMRNGQRVGFLRVPEFDSESVAAIATTIRYFIGKLEASSDYLIIDQTNNPGGMVIMSDMLLKALNGKYNPDRHIRFAVKPSQKFLREFRELRDDIAKNEDDLFAPQEVKTFVAQLDVEYNKVLKAFNEGRNLSEPVSLLVLSEYSERSFDKVLFKLPLGPLFKKLIGVDIQKHQTYTKDIYFGINELDFSGGDATPVQFQDYGRGILVGTHAYTQTAGAGGTVENFSSRGAIEFDYSLTTSLMVRYDGRIVENYGARSTLNVPILRSDVADGYANWFDRFMQTVDADRGVRHGLR